MLLQSLLMTLGRLTRLDPAAFDRMHLRNATRVVKARGMSEAMAHDIVRVAYAEPMDDIEKKIIHTLVRSVTAPRGDEAAQALRLVDCCDCGDNRAKDGKCLRCGKPVIGT